MNFKIVDLGNHADVLQTISRKLSIEEYHLQEIKDWHNQYANLLMEFVPLVTDELTFHTELSSDSIVDCLTNEEFLRTYELRRKGRQTLPDKWINPQTLEIDYKALDELWTMPKEGYLFRHLKDKNDDESKKMFENLKESKNFKRRGTTLTKEQRLSNRLSKIQRAIDTDKTIILLGMHTNSHFKLKKKLNEQFQQNFISDHVWSKFGFIEPGIKVSDSKLSIIQAVETIRRMPNLGFTGEAIKKREIAFVLDGYDVKRSLSAVYSNPNKIQRSLKKPIIEGLSDFEFAYTGLTDLELANIVRNKKWFEFLTFYRTGDNGTPEKISKEEAATEYGIKYIGDLLKSAT